MFPEHEQKFKSKLKRLVQKYHLDESVIFTGYQSSVTPWLQLSHLVVHCNREPEPFGRVLVEAMLAEKVVITNSKVATQEVLAPALRSLQVLPENPTALADQIEKLLLAPRQLHKISSALKGWSEKKFSDQKMVGAIQRIYQEVLR
jgi:glycosyltransferase involved in cell wall biosynthesis